MQKIESKYISILNLHNWDIQFIYEATLDSEAMTKMIYNDYKAVVRIKNELSDTEKERSIIHELLHLVHRDELDIAQDSLDEYAKTIYTRFHERSIEQMAKIIYNLANS